LSVLYRPAIEQRQPRQGVQRNDMPPIAPRRRPFRPHFTYLYRLVLTRSRCAPPAAQSEPFFGPFGPPGRPRGPLPPSNCAKFAGAGSFPPLRPCTTARRPAGLRPAEKLRLRRKIESCHSSRRTAPKTSEMCYVVILFRCVPPNMAVVAFTSAISAGYMP
jgi:hypothetical protein